MVKPTLLRLSTSQRRSIISSLFTATFFASIITVAASQILPCPAHKRRAYYANDGGSSSSDAWLNAAQTRRAGEKKTRRWIEEKMPE
ncbi:hypothetical protein ACEPAH_5974 [Sanghuangporus vaninii]